MEGQLVHNEGLNGHDIIIIFIIICIVGLQVYVFYKTYLKINLFKAILPESNSFKIVKIYVSEDEITQVTIEEIYNNLEKYKSPNLVNQLNQIVEDQETIQEEEFLYFKHPNNIDEFDIQCLKKSKAIYCLSVSVAYPDYANFELINVESSILKKILDSPEVFLDRACFYEGEIPVNVSGIEVIRQGTAILENGKWKIEHPCEIVFYE
ncbi:hypothetical protein VSO92_08065 [Myroides pelagicus]|uniref:hypothetical protein n=1 Tax=Myroides pelagicus TaxID=270914 RepID=UPI002DBE8D3C|nr:hypothetical protein [Myroides pelagicus]MEC4114059.1 hypothetical protein [Myroides pelagicus]